MISLQNVDVIADGRSILKPITLEVEQSRTAVIGLNGSGKSTFVRLLNGLQLPSSGTVTVDGLNTQKEGRKVRTRVGFVFQNPDNQIVYPTVREDLAFGLKNLGYIKAEVEAQIADAMQTYKITHLADRLTHQLSGGEKQMVALLGVLIMRPNYIILDEPTNHLDFNTVEGLTQALAEYPGTVITVSHDRSFIGRIADKILEIDGGRVSVYSGTYSEYVWSVENGSFHSGKEPKKKEKKGKEKKNSSPPGNPSVIPLIKPLSCKLALMSRIKIPILINMETNCFFIIESFCLVIVLYLSKPDR